jgi:hypothetical protein
MNQEIKSRLARIKYELSNLKKYLQRTDVPSGTRMEIIQRITELSVLLSSINKGDI